MIASNASILVQRYIDEVLSGDIVTGELVRKAVERHVSDLAKQSTADFPFHYSPSAAEAAIDFFPRCLRHSIGDHTGMQFHLEGWQAFGTAMMFGWKRDDDESRRFRRSLWTMGRKNGKSTYCSGLAIQLGCADVNPQTMEIEQVAEVVLCATKLEQSQKVIFAEIERMRNQSQIIKSRSKVAYHRVQFTDNYGSIACIGSDKPYSGLNPLAIFVDEYHEFRATVHQKFIDTMLTSGGARSQPIFLVATTAGDDQSYMYNELYHYMAGVLRRDWKDEEVFGFIFELDKDDDALDEANWAKANPNLGVSLKPEFLRQLALEARQSKIAFNRFDRFHCNRLVSSTEQAFDMEQWKSCAGELSDWKECDAIGGGLDVGARDDLAAWALVARFATDDTDKDGNPIYRYEPKVKCYIAEDTTRDLTKQPFAGWIYEGLLTVAKYPISALKADMIETCLEHGISDIAYDPYNGQLVAEDFEQAGITIASMAQTTGHFNEPIRELMQLLQDGRFRHDGNHLLQWCVGNAILSRDRQDRWMYDKRDSAEKIDAIVAVTMALRRAMVAPRWSEGALFVS